MAVHILILGLLFLLIVGCFIYSLISEQKIFLLATFILLMFGGVLIQSTGGIIIDSHAISTTTGWVWEDVIVTLEDSTLYLFSQICFFVGLVASAWLGLVSAFGASTEGRKSPFSY